MKLRKLSLFLGLAASLTLTAPYISATAGAEEETPIFADDFEEETISGWGILGGVGTMAVDTSRKQSGNSSLNITGREHSFNGPSISLDYYVEADETYRFTGWVYHESSETETINCTLRFSDSVNVDSYMGVAAIEAQPGEWTYFEGTVATPDDLSSTLLYFESSNETLEYNIDDIRLYGKTPDAPANIEGPTDKENAAEKYIFDFEGGFDEWVSRGDTRLIRTDEQQLSGNYSMLSTNRVKVWNGPSVSVDGIQREVEYTYEANVLYTDKKADDSHEFLLQLQYSYNGNETYAFIASTEAQKNVWSKISGVYTVPAGATNVMLYLQTANLPDGADPESATQTDLVSFYVDDISAIRSDLVGKTDLKEMFDNMSTTTLLLIIAAVVVIAVLIVVIARLKSNGAAEETENTSESSEGIESVISVLDGTAEAETEKEEKKETEAEPAAEKEAETENKDSKAEENITSEAKPEKSGKKKNKKKTAEDKRSEEVFSIETFSYEDPDAATASNDESSVSPDSPFDGF